MIQALNTGMCNTKPNTNLGYVARGDHRTEAEICNLENAAHHFQSLDLDVNEISTGTFSLIKFDGHVAQLNKKLLAGVGIEVLRGLPITG